MAVTLIVFWASLALVGVGILVAVLRRPTLVRAARVADRQLRTANRLATAAEVIEGRLGGALAPAQLDDAWRNACQISPWRAYPRSWRRVQLSSVALVASITLTALYVGGVVPPLELLGPLASGDQPSAQQDLVSDIDGAAAAADDLNVDKSSNPAGAQSLEQLQSQAAQSQAAQTALQKLSDALRQTAAARDVGDALRSGDYDAAASDLNTLATQSDQLSRISKRELGAAMERAALDSAKLDPPLAVAEDRVARALSRNVYTETRSTLQDLAKAVGDAKNGVISQEALAKELDQLQQQQQQPTAPGGGGGDIGESEVGYIPDIPGEQPNQPGLVQGLNSTISVPGPEGDPSKATHSGVGQEAGGDPFGDITSRLDVSATDLSVNAQLANDQGRGPKPNPSAPVVKISDATQNNVQPSDVVQPSDPVQAVAETKVEPAEQRSVVRNFFQPPSNGGATP